MNFMPLHMFPQQLLDMHLTAFEFCKFDYTRGLPVSPENVGLLVSLDCTALCGA